MPRTSSHCRHQSGFDIPFPTQIGVRLQPCNGGLGRAGMHGCRFSTGGGWAKANPLDAGSDRRAHSSDGELVKKYISFLGVLLAALILPETGYPGYVKGYYRKNGTYVAPHYRKDRGSSSTYKPSTSTYKRSSSTTYTPSSSTYSSGSSTSSSSRTRVRPVSSTVKSSGGAVASEAEEMSREEQTTRDRLRQIDEAIAAYKSARAR